MPPSDENSTTKSPTRPVPWNGVDVALLFLLWISLTVLCVRFATNGLEREKEHRPTPDHPLSLLIERGREQPIILLVAFLSGVVLAPLTEEFLFRLVFQGWLQKKTTAFENMPPSEKAILSGGVPIFMVSLVFALMHGGQRSELGVDLLFYGILGSATANLLTGLLGVAYLHRVCGADRSDLGFPPGRLGIDDILLGIGAFLLCAPAVYALNYLARSVFPEGGSDPIPLFLFSIALGILYYRTGRLTPCITLHACLNGFSFLVLAYSSHGG